MLAGLPPGVDRRCRRCTVPAPERSCGPHGGADVDVSPPGRHTGPLSERPIREVAHLDAPGNTRPSVDPRRTRATADPALHGLTSASVRASHASSDKPPRHPNIGIVRTASRGCDHPAAVEPRAWWSSARAVRPASSGCSHGDNPRSATHIGRAQSSARILACLADQPGVGRVARPAPRSTLLIWGDACVNDALELAP